MIPKSVSTVITERMTKDEYVSVNDFGFNSVYMTVDAPTEGYLTLLQANHDGWTAYVDGEEVDITLVNQCFMGVYLESGNHSIVFKFRPKEFFVGATITGIFWLVLIILSICFLCNRKKNSFPRITKGENRIGS